MIAEIVTVGTEILMGNIVNTNAQYLAEQCALLGLVMQYQSVVGDNHDRMLETIKTALGRADVVLLTGGLGPTEDDMTKEVCAEAMGFTLVEDPHTRALLTSYMQGAVFRVIPQNNWKQALVPEGATVLDNSNGTAPGLIMERDGKIAVLMPGPPNELIPMFENQVRPVLQARQPEVLRSVMVKVCGVGESALEQQLLDMIDAQTNPTIATYAKTGEVHLRVTAKASGEEEAKKLIKPVVKEIKSRLKEHVYTIKEEETLEMVVVQLLEKHGLTLSTAESCTGGLLSARIVSVPGASEVFKEGFVTYSNKAKRKTLDVNKGDLKKYGAVSEEVAKQMAVGGVFAADSDVCVSVTGIAGPGGATEDKPVGLVYIGCYMDDKVQVEKYQFRGNRNKIREQAVVKALDLLRRSIIVRYEKDDKDSKNDQAAGTEAAGKADKTYRAEKSAKTDKTDKSDKSDKIYKTDKADKSDKKDKTDKIDKHGKGDKEGKSRG
jgi:nicotinamide-nucleotide amidase